MGLQSTQKAFVVSDLATYVTKNQRMCETLEQKKIEVLVSPSVTSMGTWCRFVASGEKCQERQFDCIVLCHGYRTAFPWLRVPISTNTRRWFLNCFPSDLGHCLFFVGYARPHQGGIPAAEMLSRDIALILRGERALPAKYTLLARQDEAAARAYYFLSPDLHTLVDYSAFLESVARRIGCEPTLPTACVVAFNLNVAMTLFLAVHLVGQSIRIDFVQLAVLLWLVSVAFMLVYQDGLVMKWLFYPNWSVWYRQRGSGAEPVLVSSVLDRAGLRKSMVMTRFSVVLLWSVTAMYMQRMVSVPMFLLYKGLAMVDSQLWGEASSWERSLRPKTFVLHSCEWRWSDLFVP